MPSASTLARMKARSEAQMPDRFRVSIPGGRVQDPSGGGYDTDSTDVEIPCRKGDPNEREARIAGQVQQAGTAVLIVPLSAQVDVESVGVYVNAQSGRETAYAVIAAPEYSHQVDRRLVVAPAETEGVNHG